MEDFNIGAMKARNIAAQFGVIEKAEMSDEEVMKARQVGDMHPNGKWVWTEYKPGRFDWRPLKGRGGVDRTPKKGDEGDSNRGNGGGDDKKPKKPETKQETGGEKHSSSDKKEGGKEKKTPTLDDYAKKTPTKTLENASKSPKAPGSVKGAAEAELKERKNKEIAKKLNLHSKGELATELTRIASEWDSYDDAQKTQTKQAIAQAHSTVLKNITSGNASDEAISALADLTSIQNFFKDSASQPKQVGDIVKDLVSDLKAKNFNDTTAGKEKLSELSKKFKALKDGESVNYVSGGHDVAVKKNKTFDDGNSEYNLIIDGKVVADVLSAETMSKKMSEWYPNAKEKQGENKVKLTEGSFKKGVVEKNEYTGKNAIDLHDYTGESIEYYTDNGEKKKAQPYISEFYNSAKQDAVGGYEAYFDRADSIGTFRTLKEAISALETWINNMRVKGHAKPEWIYNESRGRYQMNYRFN